MPARAAAAKRYAQAAFALAQAGQALDAWQRDLTQAAALASDRQVVALLEDSKAPLEQQGVAVRRALPGLSPLAANLVQLLMAKGRLRLLPEVVGEFQELLDAQQGIQHATVVSAVPLAPEVKDRLTQGLARLTGKSVALDMQVDAAIIGGLVVRVGDQIIDGSTRTKLEGMRQALAGRAG